ncbi:hypothetical protein [Streptomyces sp. NPDC001068]|uniref:hypothetical protein n=1 Tax=Streptomyces sp. NPDC001068 TaxID=3364544 RepID=UPI0036A5003C
MTTTATPTARKRCRKTRTTKVNPRPAIVLSTIPATEIDLAPGREHMVCPECRTWCPITGMNSSPKLVPHHTDPAGTPNPRRCMAGTDRRVTIDITVEDWHTVLIEARPTTASRRATKVLPKPKATPTPAASQLTPTPLSADTIRRAFRRHQEQCRACKAEITGRDGLPLPCRDGERLAVTFLRLLRQEPRRRAIREFFAQERRRLDRHYAAAAPTRATQWSAVLPKVTDADTRRAQLPAGDAPTESPAVPLIPRDTEAYDRRQHELGRQYARTSTTSAA